MYHLTRSRNRRLRGSSRLLTADLHKLQAVLRVGDSFREIAEAEGTRRVGAKAVPGGEKDSVPKTREHEGAEAD